jgi:hypothetical protein
MPLVTSGAGSEVPGGALAPPLDLDILQIVNQLTKQYKSKKNKLRTFTTVLV